MKILICVTPKYNTLTSDKETPKADYKYYSAFMFFNLQ